MTLYGDIKCEVCGVSVAITAIHRTSPKGKGSPFIGRCSGCFDGPLDPIVTGVTDIIECHNLENRWAQGG